jgi:predicted Zn-dependent peptidase
MQTSESWVAFHSFGELLKPDSYLTLDKYLERISNIQESEVRDVAKKYFKNDAWFLSMCGDVEEDEVKVNL